MNKEIERLNIERSNLLIEMKLLATKKKKLFRDVKIWEPMSKEEKELTNTIADIASKINAITVLKRKILKN